MATQWRFNVNPLQDTIASYLAGLVGPRAYAANHGEFICELFRSQLTPYVDYAYGDLYEYILSYNTSVTAMTASDYVDVPIETAENLVGHLKFIVGRMINESTVMEVAMERPMDVRVDASGHLWITALPHTHPTNEDLTQRLIDRDTRVFVGGR